MSSIFRVFRSALLLASAAAVLCQAQQWSDSLSARLQEIRTRYALAGISGAVIKNGAVAAVGSAGMADIARNVPVTDSTMYRIASISKTITATALMQLYEQGKFRLDDDVSAALGFSLRNPSYPSVPITYRMLLSHTSSIQDGSGYNSFLSASVSSMPPPALSAVLVSGGSYYSANMWRSERPGTFYTYSNLNFGIVGTLVEALSGERFDQYCRNHLFIPLGIEAGFHVDNLRAIGNLAVLYRTSNGSWVPQADNYQGVQPTPRDFSAYVPGRNAIVFGPHGGLRISATNLAVLMLARMNGGVCRGVRILQDSTAALMITPAWTYNGSNGDNYYGLFRRWGLGTHITTNTAMGDIVVPGKVMAGHPGEAYGLISDAYYDAVNRDFGIVFITNGRDGDYQWGSSSAFYDVEEAAFAALSALANRITVSVSAEPAPVPSRLSLSSNYPNPFNPRTTIEFAVAEQIRARLTVYDLLGRRMTVLFDGMALPGRTYRIAFDGKQIGSGLYFYRLEAGGETRTRAMVLQK